MSFRFRHHYTRDEARALLPHVRQWLDQMRQHQAELVRADRFLAPLLAKGHDLGGPEVTRWSRALFGLKRILSEFQRREILVKDLERGLLDFPAVIDGREVFLCWEEGEADVEYWHDLDTGYAGREPL